MSEQRIADYVAEAYAVLRSTMRAPRTRAYTLERAEAAAKILRVALTDLGRNPDERWIAPLEAWQDRAPISPDLLPVTRETPSANETFLIAQEDGITHCDDGQPVGTYRLESVGRIRVTTEIVATGEDQ